MRREQRVKFEVGIARQGRFDQQDVAHEVGRNPQAELEAWVPVQDFDGRDAGTGRRDAVIGIPLDLDPEAVAVSDNEAEIADLRHVDARVVHLVDDAVADGHPKPGWPEGRPNQVFGAARPRRTDAWAAGGHHGTDCHVPGHGPPGQNDATARFNMATAPSIVSLFFKISPRQRFVFQNRLNRALSGNFAPTAARLLHAVRRHEHPIVNCGREDWSDDARRRRRRRRPNRPDR